MAYAVLDDPAPSPTAALWQRPAGGWTPGAIWAGWVLIAIGVGLRAALYVANRSLWGDEAAIAVNVIGRSFRELCQPLDYEQGAPLAFLFVERAAVLLLGNSELSLRLVPLLSSIVALVLFFLIVRGCFGALPGLAAVAMIALSKSLIWYSVEVKQYSSDAAAALAIIWCAIQVSRAARRMRNVRRAVLWYSLVSAILVWCSHPAVFVLAGTGLILTLEAFRNGKPRRLFGIVAATGFGMVSALCQYSFFARHLAHNDHLLSFWDEGMMPWHSSPWAVLQWFVRTIPTSLEGVFGASGIWLTMAIAPFGCAALWRSHRKTLLGLLVAPAACTMVASALHKYPFSDRLVIFLIPTAILLVAAGFEGFLRWLPARWIWIAPVLLAALLTEPAIVNVKAAVHRPLKEEMKPALVSLKHRLHRGDAVYVYFRGRPAYEYYAPLLDFEPTRIYLGNRAEGATSVIADLAPLKGIPRVWILRHTSNGTAESNLLFALNGMAVPLADQVEARHVRADLYDFSRAP